MLESLRWRILGAAQHTVILLFQPISKHMIAHSVYFDEEWQHTVLSCGNQDHIWIDGCTVGDKMLIMEH